MGILAKLMHTTRCFLCKSSHLSVVLDLGFHPLADTFLKPQQLAESEERYPLQVLLCNACGHTMISYVVPEIKRYQKNDYSYDSGNSKVSIQHFNDMAAEVIASTSLKAGDLVVDIGCSVGTLLQAFRVQSGARILGIEPSPNIAELAAKNNIPTVQDFFSEDAATQIVAKGKANVVTMTNVFNHITDLDAFMRNIVRALADQGSFVIEVPYLLPLVEKLAFDTIYLEHVSYFAVRPLVPYFKKFGLSITDLSANDYMGGTIRITVRQGGAQSPKVAEYIAREEAAQLYDLSTYQQMEKKMQQFKYSMMQLLIEARKQGGVIIGIGAATKGNTLLNYCGIDSTLLQFITDASPLKVGKYTPGTHIPILPDEAISSVVTHAVILPWNIAEFLKNKLAPKYPHISFLVPHME